MLPAASRQRRLSSSCRLSSPGSCGATTSPTLGDYLKRQDSHSFALLIGSCSLFWLLTFSREGNNPPIQDIQDIAPYLRRDRYIYRPEKSQGHPEPEISPAHPTFQIMPALPDAVSPEAFLNEQRRGAKWTAPSLAVSLPCDRSP